jgi:nucleoside-diphosphate-sugar epimerase
MSLVGQKIVATGVSSGIGEATVSYLASRNVRVVGLDRRLPSRDVGLEDFQEIDLSDPARIDRAVVVLPKSFDGLVNVAGVSSAAPVETQFRVNFLGTRYLVDCVRTRLQAPASESP